MWESEGWFSRMYTGGRSFHLFLREKIVADASGVEARLGSSNARLARLVKVSGAAVHPDYQSAVQPTHHDVAVMALAEEQKMQPGKVNIR